MPRYIVDLVKYRTLETEADSHEEVLRKIAEGGYNHDGWQVEEITEAGEL
mgnify:FL=1